MGPYLRYTIIAALFQQSEAMHSHTGLVLVLVLVLAGNGPSIWTSKVIGNSKIYE